MAKSKKIESCQKWTKNGQPISASQVAQKSIDAVWRSIRPSDRQYCFENIEIVLLSDLPS